MKNSKDIRDELANSLCAIYHLNEARSIADVLLEDLFRIGRNDLLLEKQIDLDQTALNVAVGRLLKHEPVQYVTGFSHFFGRRFAIQSGALIPRPETEELVSLIISSNTLSKPRILDVGIGSGCIAISLDLELNGEVHGLDVSEEALAIAKKNARTLGAKTNLFQQDILNATPDLSGLDILVSNPPYIPEQDKDLMHPNVLEFEPSGALFVSNSDPLCFYRRISQIGKSILKEGGKLYFEIHEKYGEDVKQLLLQLNYRDVLVHQDMQGKDRMVSATN